MSDTTPVGGGERFRLRLSAIIWFVLLAGFLLALPVLIGVSWLVVLGVVAAALILAFPGAWLVRKLFRHQRVQAFFTSFAKAFVALLFSLSIIVAAPIYYFALYTDLHPLIVPQATLSNGSKTVVFQGMTHIGSEGFYKSVVYDLEKALTEDYVLYYEGVMGDPAGDAWFSQHMAGGGDLNTNYQMLSDVCGLQFQLDYFGLLDADRKVHPERHVSADVTTGDMMREYERLMQSDPEFAADQKPAATPAVAPAADAAVSEQAGAGITGLIGFLQNGSPELRNLAGTVCRGFMTYTLTQAAAPEQMDKVILVFRNRALADRILSDTHEKIYITYGAGHLPGLFAMLQAADPNWTMESLKWLRTLEAPEDLQGQL
jgi:hypothetical protein